MSKRNLWQVISKVVPPCSYEEFYLQGSVDLRLNCNLWIPLAEVFRADLLKSLALNFFHYLLNLIHFSHSLLSLGEQQYPASYLLYHSLH